MRSQRLPDTLRLTHSPPVLTSLKLPGMSFSKIMSLIAVLTRDFEVRRAVSNGVWTDHAIVRASSWVRLMVLVAERPVTGVVLDAEVVPPDVGLEAAVEELTVRFPSLWLVLVARSGTDPWGLFRLGRAGLRSLVLTHLDELQSGIARAMQVGFDRSTEALVTRAVSAHLPASETLTVRLALRGAQLGWTTNELAARAGLTRAHLSVRLKAVGLPSAGHLLVWAKLLHAGRWLGDPGRTGESVSRQLEYSNGAAFRRALRNYTGATPMGIRDAGGLQPVLDAFLSKCGLRREQPPNLFVA